MDFDHTRIQELMHGLSVDIKVLLTSELAQNKPSSMQFFDTLKHIDQYYNLQHMMGLV